MPSNVRAEITTQETRLTPWLQPTMLDGMYLFTALCRLLVAFSPRDTPLGWAAYEDRRRPQPVPRSLLVLRWP